MSKIDKTDIENIKLITKEAKLTNLSKIKIKKGDYEIELSSESSSVIAPVSQNDLVAFQVNAGTRIDVTFHIGARDSREERFFRDISSGTEMLLEEFPKEADKCSCS